MLMGFQKSRELKISQNGSYFEKPINMGTSGFPKICCEFTSGFYIKNVNNKRFERSSLSNIFKYSKSYEVKNL